MSRSDGVRGDAPSRASAIPLERFERERPRLFGLAYRMLGSAGEAEDVLQDAFLRAARAPREPIRNAQAYLTTIVTRLCLNRLSAARVERERYLGPWLPEPIPTDDRDGAVSPLDRLVMRDSLSIAFLLLLEALSPAERAVFLLREVFDYPYHEIAMMVEKSEAACRQLASRARAHVVANRPRYRAIGAHHEALLTSFIEVVESGEIDRFLALLAEDVTLVPDGGGQRGAAIRVMRGPEPVARFILGSRRLAPDGFTYEIAPLNGQRAILARAPDGRPFFAAFVYGDEDSIGLIHVVAGRKVAGLSSVG